MWYELLTAEQDIDYNAVSVDHTDDCLLRYISLEESRHEKQCLNGYREGSAGILCQNFGSTAIEMLTQSRVLGCLGAPCHTAR